MPDTHISPTASKPKRRFFTMEQKRRIAQEAMAPDASVSRVARAHDVNANQVFKWRREYLRSALAGVRQDTTLLPVLVAEAGPPSPAQVSLPEQPQSVQDGTIELHLVHGRVVLSGHVNEHVLRIVLDRLVR